MNIAELIVEKKYEDFLVLLNGELENLSQDIVYPDQPVEKIILKILEEHLALAGNSAGEIAELVNTSAAPAAVFIAKKMAKYCKPETKADRDAKIEYLLSGREMPVGHLIEYLLIKNGGDLSGFLQKIRIPGAKKYEKEIRKIYDEAGKTDAVTEDAATEDTETPIPISLPRIKELFEYLDHSSMTGYQCDHTFALTRKFLRQKKLPAEPILEWLGENGAGCDCEVIFNVCPQWEETVGYVPPDEAG